MGAMQGILMSTAKRRPTRKRALANPPPELLRIPQRITAAALRTACTHTLRSVYHMLHKFQVRPVTRHGIMSLANV